MELAIVHVVLRLLESFLLTDNELLEIARFPDIYLGSAEKVIASRLQNLFGFEPPSSLVRYLRKCLLSQVHGTGEKATITDSMFNSVLQRFRDEVSSSHLRCEVCGYHFRRIDVGDARAEMVLDLGLEFSRTQNLRRTQDVYKPSRFCKLTLDHVVPEEGFGWTSTENLQITCEFCNQGRLIFRRALEPLSTMAAGATSAFPESRPHRKTRQVIAVASIAYSNGNCTLCENNKSNSELTVRLKSNQASALWFSPWNLEVVCYGCYDN
jgi:5-methylcytosine-specific restriction endonuclease McrA